ncbi:uracil-DNA glycosylase [Achromobacter mucicolens]|uniref:uracil-DNA glycosylase n=1 Tax=Achromobacter mucicolens TaxID=1389922 RepID=UPI000D3D1C17|nr:uracil-DNA glycosylase [Achromobacter mucicolens]PTX11221.1 uracil-DNA glycosylase [Achromobacter mucicolens]
MNPIDAAARPAPPRINPLQRIWLRELGMERLWLRTPAAPAVKAPVGPSAGVSAGPSAGSSTGASARASVGAPSALSGGAPAAGLQSAIVAPVPAEARPAVPAIAPPAEGAQQSSPAAATPAEPPSGRASSAIPASILNRTGPPPRPAPKVEVQEEAPPPIPVAEAVKDANLEQLAAQVVACAACGLCKGRRHAVVGQGAQPTRWLVVGEAPGEQEDRQGQPFVGRSGQLLDAMLAAVGMSRERDVFITNVIKCRPPGNRNPKPEEIAACSPYLMRQIALLKPERILVLGRFAAQTLLGTDATIGSLRGRVHHLKTDEGAQIPVVVSYHPAYLLRSPSEKARAWQDLKLAARDL